MENFQEQTTNSDQENIQTIQKEYEKILNEQIIPKLKPFEDSRIDYLKRAESFKKIVFGICIVLAIIATITTINIICGIVIVAFGLVIPLVRKQQLKKEFENDLKEKIMPRLLKAFPNFAWVKKTPISEDVLEKIKLFPKFEICQKVYDDCFVGMYKDIPIKMAEATYTYGAKRSRELIFTGIITQIKMNKKFKGITIVRPKMIDIRNQQDKIINLERITLEDVEFNKKYNIYSTNQIEARYLLTTSFIERLKDIQNKYFAKILYCAFYEDYVYIAPFTGLDLFSIGELDKSITDKEQYKRLFAQFASILALIDHFKLDQKTGL